MQNIFYEVDTLDKNAIESFGLSEDILMENAASALKMLIDKQDVKSICIIAGPGNNGADGIALARKLYGDYEVTLVCPFVLKTPMANLQYARALKVGINISEEIVQADIICDALFGSGLRMPLDAQTCALIDSMNQIDAIKIACDIPSGINKDGGISTSVFCADITLSMGARKQALYIDAAKDFVGEVRVGSLGISEKIYAQNTSVKLLEYSDMQLPLRNSKNTHKGNFGHLCVFAGDKNGAAKLCAKAGFAFGAGLVSIVSTDMDEVEDYLMLAHSMPSNTTAFAIGMGLGDVYDKVFLKQILLDSEMPALLDADLLQSPVIEKILTRHKNLVITPHPKEFSILLQSLGITISFRHIYISSALSMSIALLTPLMSGEILKIELLKREGIIDRTPGYTTFALEKALDSIMLLLLGLVFLLVLF